MGNYEYISDRWKDRSTQNPRRRKLTTVGNFVITNNTIADNSELIVDVDRDDIGESTEYELGTPFNSTNMNGLESRINSAIKKCVDVIDLGSFNTKLDGTSGIYLSTDALLCPILELFYSNDNKKDGITSERIFIANYNTTNKISLDQIACDSGSSNTFYIKTVTLEIKKSGNRVNIKKDKTRSKRLVIYENGRINVEQSSSVDIVLYKVLGYRFDNSNNE